MRKRWGREGKIKVVQCDRIRYEREICEVHVGGMREKEVHVCEVEGYEEGKGMKRGMEGRGGG